MLKLISQNTKKNTYTKIQRVAIEEYESTKIITEAASRCVL